MKFINRHPILLSSVVLLGLLTMFLCNISQALKDTEQDYTDGRAYNLDKNLPAKELSDLLYINGYVDNINDADFIADTLTARLRRGLHYTNLYNLQKRWYGTVPMLLADSLGVLKNRVQISNERIGLSSNLPNVNDIGTAENLGQGDGIINTQIISENDDVNGVLVRLTTYYYDNDTVREEIASYAKTDSLGVATFAGLNQNNGYSVIPIRKGFEYGSTRGVPYGKFKKESYTYKFKQQEHHIQMIGNYTLKQIKNDGTLTIRTPKEYKQSVIFWFISVLFAWWILSAILILKKKGNQYIIAAAMFITEFCVLIMYSIQNPLTEDLRGKDMAIGVLIGLLIILLFQFVDFIKLYQQKYNLRWLKSKLNSNIPFYEKIWDMLLFVSELPFGITNALNKSVPKYMLPKGIGWFILAIIITLLLFPFGQSIGGATVNLVLGNLIFQPSEIAKYFIIICIACFFTQNTDKIIKYSRPSKGQIKSRIKNIIQNRIGDKIKTLSWIIVGLTLLFGIYYKLGDMGPALVIGISFILLYSLIKSKENFDDYSETERWQRIFTCDFALLVYGVVSFAAFCYLFSIFSHAIIGAIFWFFCWIIFGIIRHRQFFETAFILNAIIFIFAFGGQIFKTFDYSSDIAVRFEERTNMCTNTWGTLDLTHNGKGADAVSNTQVANGLWSMATGGFCGQGLGKGSPNLTPAFHTDMILASIAEQTGWFGLLLVVFTLAIILRKIVIIGYDTRHPFAFYLCSGISITIGVQFFIIALGSSGMIPLTGVAVPFLSYGKVSMILNLSALGIALSLSNKNSDNNERNSNNVIVKDSVGSYNQPIAIISLTFIILTLFVCGVWFHYCCFKRSDTLKRVAFTYTRYGIPLIEYNPRISLLTKEMFAGNIYDRNGILLATSNKNNIKDSIYSICGIDNRKLDIMKRAHFKRYYPFGEHLFFMLGDRNTGLFFTYNESNPLGYMAEVQHLSYLRNYSNTRFDSKGNPIDTVRLTSQITPRDGFIGKTSTTYRYIVRDNTDLVPYLKEGIYGSKLKEHNKEVQDGKFDLHLTIDAKLQTKIQNHIINYVKDNAALRDNNLLRISVVVLDASNGDLITSANYPLPDYARLWEEYNMGHKSYTDNYKKNTNWAAYTDRDLGLTYQTNPGSTAKVISAMAGFQKLGLSAQEKKYYIFKDEIIEAGRVNEPHNRLVTMRDAIVESSNCYFIKFVNENDLYLNLDSIYEATGIRIDKTTPYYLSYNINPDTQNVFKRKIQYTRNIAIQKYQEYTHGNEHEKMNKGYWMWAWGQGTLDASPLNMARAVSAVVNKGRMPITQFIYKTTNDYTQAQRKNGFINLLNREEADVLKNYMKAESQRQESRNNTSFPRTVGGKTGTPEREIKIRDNIRYDRRNEKIITVPVKEKPNDGWYIFFIEGSNHSHPLSIAIRMERCTGSGQAVKLANSIINNTLTNYNP
ncbi:FtsW/RodA/SpoVE family cell cycle protein [Pseudobutyrivibrio sp.]|uniref:FtsW/RodA/SpoVE family cell cycle protein n=1 Tax=Pseudobutyrivibrio sp. TaxID=2014367 RepID=UPI0038641EA8